MGLLQGVSERCSFAAASLQFKVNQWNIFLIYGENTSRTEVNLQ